MLKRKTNRSRLFYRARIFFIKGALSGLRPFLATESLFEKNENAFHFTLKVLFVLTIF